MLFIVNLILNPAAPSSTLIHWNGNSKNESKKNLPGYSPDKFQIE
jgi:hypothetical protein